LIRSLKSRFVQALAAVALAGLLGACGSSNNNASPASVRFINASHTSALTLTLNGSVQFSNVATASSTSYSQITASTYTVSVTSTNGSLSSTAEVVGIGSGQTYSLLAYDRDGSIVVTLITENQSTPTSGYASFGISNDSPDSGALDVYVVPTSTTSLSGLAPTFLSVGFGAAPAFTTVVAGTYQIIATATGNPNDVRLKIASQQISSTQILMLAFTSTTGGALVNGVFALQNGGVSFQPTTSARVRGVSALPSSPATQVSITAGGTALTPIFAPNPGTYTLITGGSTSYSISVGSTAIASLPAATFATGGDYTILVYGTVAAPVVSIFTDDNQLPIAGDVNLRLVNAAVTVTGGVTMYDNNVQVASAVAYGAASPYFGIAESATSSLELTEPTLGPLTIPAALNVPGSVYTVFVIDATLVNNALTANGVSIIRDR
jgi:hypothetical protein